MKILFITTVFQKPESGASIYTDLVEELFNQGHEIKVAVSDENSQTNIFKERNVDVLRIKVNPYYDVSLLQKGIASITMNYKVIKGIKKYFRDEKFDLILFVTPPINVIKTVKWAMKYYKSPSYLMLKDIFPRNAVDIEIFTEKSIFYKYYRKKEIDLYKNSTLIGCMSIKNREHVLKHNLYLDPNKINIFPNTKKISPIIKKDLTYPMRNKYKIGKNEVVFLFGGNMGKIQALDFLSDAIITLKNVENIFFLIVGRGTEKNRISKKLEKSKVKNYLILDNLPRDDYEKLVKECDVGLILVDNRFTIPNYPSRILSYMDYEIPIIAATDKATDILQTIESAKCGLVGYSDDMDQFIKNIKILSKDDQLRLRLGMNGRQYFMKHFDVSQSVKILEKYFEKEAKNV